MKIDRQLGILSILLQNASVTAPYLAEQFEVSRRTINRDIEDLCKAGTKTRRAWRSCRHNGTGFVMQSEEKCLRRYALARRTSFQDIT